MVTYRILLSRVIYPTVRVSFEVRAWVKLCIHGIPVETVSNHDNMSHVMRERAFGIHVICPVMPGTVSESEGRSFVHEWPGKIYLCKSSLRNYVRETAPQSAVQSQSANLWNHINWRPLIHWLVSHFLIEGLPVSHIGGCPVNPPNWMVTLVL